MLGSVQVCKRKKNKNNAINSVFQIQSESPNYSLFLHFRTDYDKAELGDKILHFEKHSLSRTVESQAHLQAMGEIYGNGIGEGPEGL